MKRILTYLLQQEKLTIFVGVLLGLVFITVVELNWGNYTTIVHAQTDAGIESKVSELVNLEEENEIETETEDALAPRLINNIIEEDTLLGIETKPNGVSGGVELTAMTVVDDEVVDGSIFIEIPTEKEEEVLDATGVPNDVEGCKSWNFTYMAYTKVTNEASDQYNFLYNEDLCYTDPLTGIRMSGGRYCIAVGSFYSTKIGQKIDLLLSNGEVLKCILGDCKADEHTDETHRFHAIDGSVAEFVVDYDYFTDTSQWESLHLTTIEEVRVVAEEGDDVEQIREQIARHKEEVEQKRLAREAELEALALAADTENGAELTELQPVESVETEQSVAEQPTTEQVTTPTTELTPEVMLALAAMQNNLANAEGTSAVQP